MSLPLTIEVHDPRFNPPPTDRMFFAWLKDWGCRRGGMFRGQFFYSEHCSEFPTLADVETMVMWADLPSTNQAETFLAGIMGKPPVETDLDDTVNELPPSKEKQIDEAIKRG